MSEIPSPEKQAVTDQVQPNTIPVEVPPGSLEGVIDWSNIFGRVGPVELEIGFGKGAFLLSAPPRFPDRNYFGIEKSRKYLTVVRGRLEKARIPNVRILRTEAGYFLERFVADDSLEAIHIYHPDPWPKRRHHRRRLVKSEFLSLCLKKIRPGGTIHVSTDHENYFESIMEETTKFGLLHPNCSIHYSTGVEGPGEVVTHYARKFSARGSTIHRIDIVKSEVSTKDSASQLPGSSGGVLRTCVRPGISGR